jgi:hypothetical protein
VFGELPHLPTAPGALAFVTDATSDANLGGVAGADEWCRNTAAAAYLPLPGSFVAWISISGNDAKDRLTFNGPWNRVDGVRIAATKAALIDGVIDTGMEVTEFGVPLPGDFEAWTGTGTGGTAVGNQCADWTDVGVTGTYGVTDEAGFFWTIKDVNADCQESRHVYCFGNVLLLGWDNFELGDFRRWGSTQGEAP